MDLLTQGVLGATVGQVGFQKILGRRALLWGALIGMLPDADIFVKLFSSDICAEMLHHRGFTHSLFFAPLVAPVGAWLSIKIYKETPFLSWMWLWFWALITHPLLDVFTTYGTQLLAPFCQHRFSFNAVPIIDPFYTLPLLVSVMIGLFCKNRLIFSQITAAVILTLTTCYLFLGIAIHDITLSASAIDKIHCVRKEAFPTLFTILHRRLVIDEGHQYRIAYIHFKDIYTQPIAWKMFPKAHIPKNVLNKREARIFQWFADDWVLPEYEQKSLYLKDIRFGFPEYALKGLWGLKITHNTISWERFVSRNIGFADIKSIWQAIFTK